LATSYPEIPFSAEMLCRYYSAGFQRMMKDPGNPGAKTNDEKKHVTTDPLKKPTCLG